MKAPHKIYESYLWDVYIVCGYRGEAVYAVGRNEEEAVKAADMRLLMPSNRPTYAVYMADTGKHVVDATITADARYPLSVRRDHCREIDEVLTFLHEQGVALDTGASNRVRRLHR